MKQTPLLTAFFIFFASASAQAESFTASPAYKECSALAATNPQAALVKAEEWLKIEDGIGAYHCKAMALYGLKQYADSAASLSLVRDRLDPKDIMLRTYVARQASRAWVLASRAETALATLSAQIDTMNQEGVDNATEARLTAELLLDRATIRQQYGQNAEAVQDLDHAVSLRPSNDDVLLARAEAFIALNDKALAKEDLQAILRMNPTHEKAVSLMRSLRDVPTPAAAGEMPATLPKTN
ncbi:MAG: tetratricopeptide repeat protein [Rickettsiales bacterium]